MRFIIHGDCRYPSVVLGSRGARERGKPAGEQIRNRVIRKRMDDGKKEGSIRDIGHLESDSC